MLKKFLSLLIALSMLFSVVAYAAGSSGGGASGGGIGGSGNSGTGTSPATPVLPITMSEPEISFVNGNAYEVSVDLENLTSDAVLRIALYNDNQLTGFISRTLYSGTVAATAPTTYQINAQKSDKVKAFLFEKGDYLSPIATSKKDLSEGVNLLLTMPGSTVSEGTYKNVTVSSAVGDGNVYLNNIEIEGDLNIYGGGSNSIHLSDCLVEGTVKMASELSYIPRLALTNTPVDKIIVSKNATVEALDTVSAIKNVEAAADVNVRGTNTNIEKITIASDGEMPVMISGQGKVSEVIAETKAMIMSDVVEKVVIPKTAKENISVEVMGDKTTEVVVNTSKGAAIKVDPLHSNVTVSTDLETPPEGVTIGDNQTQSPVTHFHKWNDGTVTKEPTTSSEGIKTYRCKGDDCNETKTESIPKLPKPQNPGYYFTYNQYGLFINWPEYNLADDEEYYVTVTNKTNDMSSGQYPALILAPVLVGKTQNEKTSITVHKGTDFGSYSPIYNEYEIATLTVSGETPYYTVSKDADGNLSFDFDFSLGMLIYSVSSGYSGGTTNGSTKAALEDGYTVTAQLMTWTLNADNTYADINITMPKSVTYNEPDEDEETTISFRKWKTDIMFDGYEEVADTKSLEVNGVKVVSGKAETMSEFLFDYDQTKGNIIDADFVVELDGVEKDRILGNVDVTISNDEVPFSVNSDGTLSFDETANGCYAYKTTKGGAGRIAFTNGALADGWDLPTLSVGETIDIMHINCTYDESTKAISATLSKHTTKTYTLASDGSIWFSETDYGYPCVQWSPAELSDDEFYVCNDMEWFDTTGYLYFELLDIEESGYIPITISRGTWENKTPLYTSNEAAHVTITDTEQNLSLVEQSDGRYKITSHLNNFDAQCFVYQVRSKTGMPLLTGFTTGKIYVSPHDNIEVVVRQVKWNISSDKKQIEYTITPLYKITTYTNTQTQTEETYVSTYDEMKAALNKGGVVKLNADIKTSSMLTLNTGDVAILDLNGHTLDIPRIEARNGKNLTINQTTSGSSLINSNGTQEVSAYYGDLTLNGGTYEKIGSQYANNITLNAIVGSYNNYSFYYGTNVSITDCTFGSDTNASKILIWDAEEATITDTVVYGDSYSISFSSVNKAVVENTTITASNDAISCQTNTNLELKNVNATASGETIRVHADCNVTIDGGEYEVTTSYSNLIYMIGGPTVTIKGGKFTGGKNLANPSAANVGTLNISGGDFTYYTDALLGKAMTCNISGGIFGYDISEYVEDSCSFTNNNDGTYTVSSSETNNNNIWLEMDGDDLNLVFEDEEGLETDQWYYYYQNGTMLTSDSVNYIDITWYLKNITESTLCSFEVKKGVYNSQESVATLENAVDVVINSNIPNVSVSPQADGSYKIISSENTGYFYTVKNPDGTSITSGFTSDGTLLCGLYEGCTIDVRECSITVADDALSADVIMSASVTLSDITLATSSTEEVEVSNLMALQSTIDAGKVAVLTADISSDSRIYFKTGAPATIKLNGHTITAPTLMAGSGKTLTVDGTVAGSAVANTFNANAYSNVTLLGGSYGNVIIAKARRFYADGITASTSTANRTLQGNWCSDITIKNSSFEHIGALQYQIAISMDDCKNITLENVDVSSAGVYSYGADISRCENTVITGGAYNSAQYPGLRIVDGSATITNAKVGSGGDHSAFLAQDGAQVIISGGTYATPSSSIIGLSNDATRVTINSGSFCSTSTYATKHVSYMNDSSDLLTINGGTFSGVTGLCSYPERAKVCGGTFSFDPSNAIDASKYGVTSNTDGTYTIYKKAEATISNLRIAHYISTIYGIHWDGEAPTGPSGNYYKVYGTSDGGTTWQLIEYAYFETKYPLSSQSATNYNGIKVEYIKDGVVAATITDLTLNVKSEVITSSTVPAATFAEPDANGQSAVTVTGLTPNTYFRLVVDGKVAGMSTKSFAATSSSQGSAQGRLSLSADEINNGSYKVYEFVNPTISDDGKNFSYAVAESAWQNCKNIQ